MFIMSVQIYVKLVYIYNKTFGGLNENLVARRKQVGVHLPFCAILILVSITRRQDNPMSDVIFPGSLDLGLATWLLPTIVKIAFKL